MHKFKRGDQVQVLCEPLHVYTETVSQFKLSFVFKLI